MEAALECSANSAEGTWALGGRVGSLATSIRHWRSLHTDPSLQVLRTIPCLLGHLHAEELLQVGSPAGVSLIAQPSIVCASLDGATLGPPEVVH